MPDQKELLKALLPDNVVEKAYDEVLSGPAKEVGKLASDVVKTARLLLAPLQLAAAFQDRFERMAKRISARVPEDRRITAPPEVTGPALRQMKFLDEGNPLWQMFEELLSRAVDHDEVTRIHPSFSHIISQLSPDEAVILYYLKGTICEFIDTMDYIREENRFENRRFEQNSMPRALLALPDNIDLYYSHLESLCLVLWPVVRQEPVKDANGIQTGIRRWSKMHLTDFGRLFVDACVPDTGFSGLRI